MIWSRRRFLSLASAACLGSALPAGAYRWEGVALGARTQIILDHPNAARLASEARAEILRLERIFSLYLPDSELVRLNSNGYLQNPSFEMLECLSLAQEVYIASNGLFDPTVQPLWSLLARAKMQGEVQEPVKLEEARAAVGFDRVRFDSGGVSLGAGQAITLNGIAQGYIADNVAKRFQAAGVTDVLIDTGEIVALGKKSGQTGWPVRIANTGEQRLLTDQAIATSATFGMAIGAEGQQGHILHPDGREAMAPTQVSVSAPRAGLADALSTALCLTPEQSTRNSILRQFPTAKLVSSTGM